VEPERKGEGWCGQRAIFTQEEVEEGHEGGMGSGKERGDGVAKVSNRYFTQGQRSDRSAANSSFLNEIWLKNEIIVDHEHQNRKSKAKTMKRERFMKFGGSYEEV
jgi:hypothetical protein